MEINKTNRVFKKLNGYQKANRDRFLLLSFRELTQEEFLLYELCIAITDWDIKHLETYGTFNATNSDLAQILTWKSDSTVSRYKNRLIGKRYIEVVGDRFRVKDFEKWELKKRVVKMQDNNAEKQIENTKTQDISADLQDIPF